MDKDTQIKLDNIIKVFREEFYFSENDVEKTIQNILQNNDIRLINRLAEIVYEFIGQSNLEKEEKNRLGKKIIENCLSVYQFENSLINKEFAQVLRIAKSYNIDPYKFAIKSNIRSASVQKFTKSIYALCKKEYFDPVTQTYSPLFNENEMSQVINECAYVACKLSEENIQNVLSILNQLSYDKQNSRYYFDPKALIKSNKSLLTLKPARLSSNIKYLTTLASDQGYKKSDLLSLVALSPAILTISIEKLDSFKETYKKALLTIMPKPKEEKTQQEAEEIASKMAYSFDKMVTIQNINLENLTKNMATYQRFLGNENAVNFSRNLSLLSKEPKFVEYLMLRLSQEENNGNKDFRKFVVEHASMITEGNHERRTVSNKKTEKHAPNPLRERIIFKAQTELPTSENVDQEIENFIIDGKTKKQVEEIITRYKEEKLTGKKKQTKTQAKMNDNENNVETKEQNNTKEIDFKSFILNFQFSKDNYPKYPSFKNIYPFIKALELSGHNMNFNNINHICNQLFKLDEKANFYKNQLQEIIATQGKIKGLTGYKFNKKDNQYEKYVQSYIEQYYKLINDYNKNLKIDSEILISNIKLLSNELVNMKIINNDKAKELLVEAGILSQPKISTNYDLDKLLMTFWNLTGIYKNAVVSKTKEIFGENITENAEKFIKTKVSQYEYNICPGINLAFFKDFKYYLEKDYTGDYLKKYEIYNKVNLDNYPNYKNYRKFNNENKFTTQPIIKSNDNSEYYKILNTSEGNIYYRLDSNNPCFIHYTTGKFKKFESTKSLDKVAIINENSLFSNQSTDFNEYLENISNTSQKF